MLKKKHVEPSVSATPECHIYRPRVSKARAGELGVTYASPLARKAHKAKRFMKSKLHKR